MSDTHTAGDVDIGSFLQQRRHDLELLGDTPDEDVAVGDAESWQTGANVLAELTRGAGGLIAAEQKKKDDAAAAARYAAEHADETAAAKAATEARKKAGLAAIDWKTAQLKSDANPKDVGLKAAAARANDLYRALDIDAQAAEMRAAYYRPPLAPSPMPQAKGGGGITWTTIAIGAGAVVGGGGLLYLIYRLFRGRR